MLLPDSARNRLIGIALISCAYFCFAVLDATAKWLVRSLPVVEVVWLRFVGHVLFMSVPMARAGQLSPRAVRRPWLQLLRASMLLSMTGMNFWALQYLQLAETGAIQFSVPVMIALISAWRLKERPDLRRWIAIVAGFAGVLLVIRPGSQAFHPAILLAVLNAVLYALFNLLTRRMAASESPASMQLISAIGATAITMPFAWMHWRWPEGAATWALIVACGLCGGIGHYCVAKAHRHASAAVLGPFLYQQIIYMTLWGWLLFSQVPDASVVAGGLVVVGSGLYLLWLEVRHR
jgi:drug/metabolite transporter (DMT)-like permease